MRVKGTFLLVPCAAVSTPEDPKEGGWQPQGWQSEWQKPGGWQQPQPSQQPVAGGWQQAPDGQWMQAGAQQSSGKATAALVLGILGLVLCPFICSILALVFGYQARREIDASGGRMTGRGNATAGVVLGWIGVAFLVLLIGLIILGATVGDDSSSPSPAGSPAALLLLR
jgi:Domain of unknown function (DUF4190)